MHPWPLTKFWRMKVKGTIHAGAHMGEEAHLYKKYNFGPIVWIEAIPELAEKLKLQAAREDSVINATLWSIPGKGLSFKITNLTGSSSLFDLADHLVAHPEVRKEREIQVTTTTVDDLMLGGQSNLLVLDLQGAEYEALKGSISTLETVDYVIAEVNRKELYRGIRLVSDVDNLLGDLGFKRVATRWTRHGWGEALFIRRDLLGRGRFARLILKAKTLIYWIWLHFFEIPIVYSRAKIRRII